MRKLRWGGMRVEGRTVWRGWADGQLLATVERRGEHWGITLHRDDGDEVVDGLFSTHDGAQRSAENRLFG